MACEICGRASCMRSFHSIEDQERFDARKEMSSDVDELRSEIQDLKEDMTSVRNDAIEDVAKTFDDDADKMEEAWKEFVASGSDGPATSYHTLFRGIAKDIRAMKES